MFIYKRNFPSFKIPQFLQDHSSASPLLFALLYHLGAIDEHGQLTEDKGKLMVELSLDPRYTAAVITANGEEYKVFNEVLIIVSLMQFE